MPVIVDDDEMETFPANRADQALDVGILPGRSWSGQHFFHPEGCNPATEPRSIDAVPVPQKIARGIAPRECLDDLLPRPLPCRVLGDVEMDHLAPLKAQHDEHVQNPKRDGGDGEEVDAGESRSLITEECPPTLRRWASVSDHVLGHRRLRNLDTQHAKLAVHAGRSPEGIFLRNTTDEVSDILRDRRSPTAPRSGSPRPVQPETAAVPAHQRIGFEDSQCVDTAGPKTV